MARLWLVGALLVAIGAAHAEPPAAERPWETGVSADDQAAALALFKDGNELFEQSQHTQAVAKYREALARWDHPRIRYNLAVALIHLDRPLEAYEQIGRALAFGSAPLSAEQHAQALTYQKLLRGQLAELTVLCDEPGAEVTLDGDQLFGAPGRSTRVLTPGKHQLVATSRGRMPDSRALVLLPGANEQVRLAPAPAPTNRVELKTRRRWAAWKPWLVGASGVLVAAIIGVSLELQARADYNSYDANVAQQCPMGCPTSTLLGSTRDLKSRAAAENGAAIGALSAGAGLVVAGIAMLILNAPRVEAEPARISFAPLIAPRAGGAALAVGF
jgi:hypothetical protein